MKNECPFSAERFFRHQTNRGAIRTVAHTLTAAVALLAFAACSSGPYQQDDPWKRQYVDSPDRVWQAIQISLGELDYMIESENRPDGKIRAVSTTDESDPSMALLIDQVQWVEGQVNVFVKPADGNAESEAFQNAAKAFLAELDKHLKG